MSLLFYKDNGTEEHIAGLNGQADLVSGKGIAVQNGEVSQTRDQLTFTGTRNEWDSLSVEQKAQYGIANITDDVASGIPIIVDAITNGDMNAVTSNAVFDSLAGKTDNEFLGNYEGVASSTEDAIARAFSAITVTNKTITGYFSYSGTFMCIAFKYSGGQYGSMLTVRNDGLAWILHYYTGTSVVKQIAIDNGIGEEISAYTSLTTDLVGNSDWQVIPFGVAFTPYNSDFYEIDNGTITIKQKGVYSIDFVVHGYITSGSYIEFALNYPNAVTQDTGRKQVSKGYWGAGATAQQFVDSSHVTLKVFSPLSINTTFYANSNEGGIYSNTGTHNTSIKIIKLA